MLHIPEYITGNGANTQEHEDKEQAHGEPVPRVWCGRKLVMLPPAMTCSHKYKYNIDIRVHTQKHELDIRDSAKGIPPNNDTTPDNDVNELTEVHDVKHGAGIRDRDKDNNNDVVIIQVVDIRDSAIDVSLNNTVDDRVHTQQHELNEVHKDAPRLHEKEEPANEEAILVDGARAGLPMHLFIGGVISPGALQAGPHFNESDDCRTNSCRGIAVPLRPMLRAPGGMHCVARPVLHSSCWSFSGAEGSQVILLSPSSFPISLTDSPLPRV